MADVSPLGEIDLEVHSDPAHHIEWTLTSGSRQVLGFAVRLMGWTAAETSGSASCTINVYDGADTNGPIVLPIKMASGQSSTDWFGPNGIMFRNAVTISMASGQAQGSVFYTHHRG